MPSYRLRCLGVPTLTAASGEHIRFRTRKHFALLVRLACDPGHRFTRHYLIDLLWPGAEARLGAHSLAQAISVLNAKLGRGHLVTQRATVALADGAVDADVHHLDRCDAEIAGDFLEGFEVPAARGFEEWKGEVRARLLPKIRDCLVRHMDSGRRIGDYATVERHARVLEELDPLCEDAARGLIEARAWVGDRGNALKVYGRFEARLAEDLGAKPSPDLARVAHLLREGRRAPGSAPVLKPAPPGQRTEKRFDPETLIGREREFGALYDAWLEARQRRPRIVLLTADPGVGKTTLANAFAATCQMDGGVVARAQAYDAERELPFTVLSELVRQLTIQRAIGSADPEALSELTRVTPEIFQVFPGVPKPVDWAAEITPLRLADAFLKVVTAAAEESPVLLVVDDVHAADNATAAILHLVARKLPLVRLLVILAARRGELRASAAPAALAADASIEALQGLEMDPLAPEAAAALVARVAAPAVPERGEPPADRILRASSGNPLALELLTKEWVEHGPEMLLRDLSALDTLPSATIGIPRAIRVVFERQVQRLDPRTRAVLDLGAVLGRRLDELSLYAAVDCSSGQALEALARLRDEGMLREVHGDLEFRNELIRAQAYYAVPGKARQHLHRRVAELLEVGARDDGVPHLEVAWHYLRGGEMEKAGPHATKAAEASLEIGAPAEAEHVLRAVLQVCPRLPDLTHAKFLLSKALLDQSKAMSAIPLLEELTESVDLQPEQFAECTRLLAAATFIREPRLTTRYRDAANRARDAAQAVGDPQLVGRALFECARAAAEAGDEQTLRLALRELELLPREAPVVLHALGFCYFMLNELAPARTALEAAIDKLRGSHDVVTLNHVFNGYGLCLEYLGRFVEARSALRRALTNARKACDDSRASMIMGNLGAICLQAGDINAGIELTEAGIKLALGDVNQPRLLICYTNLAEAYLVAGKPERARASLDQAARLMAHDQSWRARVIYWAESAAFDLVVGNAELAVQRIETVEREIGDRAGDLVPELGSVERLRVFKLGYSGNTRAAHDRATQLRRRFKGRHPLFYLDALAAVAWCEQQLGGIGEATTQELAQFSIIGALGKRAALAAQGFPVVL